MESLQQFFRNLGTGRVVVIAVVGAITFATLVFILGRLQTSPMSVLFSDLEPAEAAEVAQRLESEQIPYESGAGGRSISVPRDQVDRLRLLLAGEGLTGGVIGKEIFDKEGSFGRTNFELNVNYVRAIEGELARTIGYISTVREARVHIVMPERRPFQRELALPSASILLRTKAGGVTGEQVRSIQALVASAVPGLSSDQVTLTDTSGRLLSDGNRAGALGGIANLEEARLGKEELFRNKIESMLTRSVGPGNVRAEVSVQMTTSRSTTHETRFDPDGQVIAAQAVTKENTQDRDSNGQVTVGNALPEASSEGGANAGPTKTRSRSEETTDFDNTKIERTTVTEPGEITQLRVSVMINQKPNYGEDGSVTSYTPYSDSELEQFRNLVLSAVPYDEAREGDQVTVISLPFLELPDLESVQPTFNLFGLNKEDLAELIRLAATIITVVLLIVLVVRPIVVRIIEAIPDAPPPDPNQLEHQNRPAAALMGPGGEYNITPEIVALAAQGDEQARAMITAAKAAGTLQIEKLATDARIDVARVEGKVQDSALKKVADIVRSNPEESVAIVRSWLYAE